MVRPQKEGENERESYRATEKEEELRRILWQGIQASLEDLSEIELTVGYLFNARALIKKFSSEGSVKLAMVLLLGFDK